MTVFYGGRDQDGEPRRCRLCAVIEGLFAGTVAGAVVLLVIAAVVYAVRAHG